MKRSAGVTFTSICVIAASVAWCVYVIWALRPIGYALWSRRPAGGEGLAVLLAASVFELLFGVWGIATGIALLRLRRWAWACILVISGVTILFSAPELLRAPKLIRATTGVSTVSSGHFVSGQYFHLIALGIVPVILGIWWLVFFLRHSVSLQFAPTTPTADGSFAPARSGAVDASAIVLLFGSALVLLGAVMMPLTALDQPQPPPRIPFPSILVFTATMGVCLLLVCVWGVVTGVGVLKRRPWGRIFMIVTAAVCIAFCALGSIGAFAPLMMPPEPNTPASILRAAVIGVIFVLLVPIGVSIWWLVLFMRPRIAAEFASPSFGAAAVQVIPSPLVSAETEGAASVPVQFNASVVSREPSAPHIPMSIRVIAVLEILLGAMAFLSLSFLWSAFAIIKPPLLIFGFLVHGWSIAAFYIVSGIVPIVVCAAILLRKRWGLDALIVFLLAEVANFALSFISPARTRFNSEMLAQMNKWMAQIKMPTGSPPPPNLPQTHMMLLQGLVIGITAGLYIVLLYFLFTRRRAFRAACVSNHS